MAIYYPNINLTTTLDDVYTLNVFAGDQINANMLLPDPNFTEWSVLSASGTSSINPTSGTYYSTACTIVPDPTASSYSLSVWSFTIDPFFNFIVADIVVQGTITPVSGDSTPDQFTFTDQSNVSLNSVITSNTITVSGINTTSAISISGGTYSINGGTYTSASGTVSNGNTVSVRHTSSGSFSTGTNTVLTIGGVSDTFTSTTLAADTTPGAFTFTDQSGVNPSTLIESNTITVTDINTTASISVSGGEYSINGGAYTSASGSVSNGNTVKVRHTSSSAFSTSVNTTLTIGGVSDTFTSTTRAADTTPNAFTFTDQSGVNLNSVITSNSITVSGIEAATSISVSGGTYNINGGGYTGTSGVVSNGNTVSVRHTSSGSFSTATNTVLTIGGVSDTFTSTTLGADTTPDAFAFTDQSGVNPSTIIESNSITVSGINTTAGISVSGGEYSINGGAYTATSGSVSNGNTVRVRHTSSSAFSSSVNTTLTIGGVTDTFTSTTRAADTTPNQFTFTDTTGAILNTTYTSGTITVSGLEPNFSITINASGGTVDAGTSSLSGTFASSKTVTTSGTGTLVLAARATSSGSFSTAVNCTVSIGSVSDIYTVTTAASDNTPDQFTFTDQSNVNLSTLITSNTITVSGINTTSTISISGGEYSINGGTYTAVTGSVSNGNTVAVRHTSSGGFNTATNTSLTIGGVSDTFTSTTRAPDTTPNQFTFTDVSGASTETVYTSNTVTVTGLEPNYSITITGTGGLVDAGTSSLSGTYAGSKTVTTSGTGTLVVSARVVSSNLQNTTVSCTVAIGSISDIYSVTTFSSEPTPNVFTFNPVTSVATSTTQTSNVITVSGLGAGVSASVIVSGGEYNKNGTGWSTANTTAVNGDTFQLRHTSAATNNTNTDTILYIGARSGLFRSTTGASAGGGLYGLQILNNSSVPIIDLSSRVPRFVLSGTTSTIVPGGSTTINVPDMQNDDTWTILYTLVNGGGQYGTVAKYSGYFTITNESQDSSLAWNYWVIRS